MPVYTPFAVAVYPAQLRDTFEETALETLETEAVLFNMAALRELKELEEFKEAASAVFEAPGKITGEKKNNVPNITQSMQAHEQVFLKAELIFFTYRAILSGCSCNANLHNTAYNHSPINAGKIVFIIRLYYKDIFCY